MDDKNQESMTAEQIAECERLVMAMMALAPRPLAEHAAAQRACSKLVAMARQSLGVSDAPRLVKG